MPNIPLLPKQPEPVAWRFDEEVAKGVAVTVYKSVANSWIARGYKATPLFELATTQPVIPEQALNTAKLINKFYERYPLEIFANDSERAEALGYFMAGAELQCFGDFIAYDDHVQESE